jgi:hypothetical protein
MTSMDITTRLWNWGLSKFTPGTTLSSHTLKVFEAHGKSKHAVPVHVRAISEFVEVTIDQLESVNLVLSTGEARELATLIGEAASRSEAFANERKAAP